MRSIHRLVLLAALAGCKGGAAPEPEARAGAEPGTDLAAEAPAPPEVGSAAPEFSLRGSDGRTHTLAEHRGQRAVVVAWFPKAFTGG